jgi:hypothetical protein
LPLLASIVITKFWLAAVSVGNCGVQLNNCAETTVEKSITGKKNKIFFNDKQFISFLISFL